MFLLLSCITAFYRIFLRYFFLLLLCLSCKDFKNWESKYSDQLRLSFEPAKDPLSPKDPLLPKIYKHLNSQYLKRESYKVRLDDYNCKKYGDDMQTLSFTKPLLLHLCPNRNSVSFEIENVHYYQRITIFYKRLASLISPEAGGMQIQYHIQNIRLDTKEGKYPIFDSFEIKHSIPVKQEQFNNAHVTLFY